MRVDRSLCQSSDEVELAGVCVSDNVSLDDAPADSTSVSTGSLVFALAAMHVNDVNAARFSFITFIILEAMFTMDGDVMLKYDHCLRRFNNCEIVLGYVVDKCRLDACIGLDVMVMFAEEGKMLAEARGCILMLGIIERDSNDNSYCSCQV